MRQPLIPLFVVLALTALPVAFIEGVRAGSKTHSVAAIAEAGRHELNS